LGHEFVVPAAGDDAAGIDHHDAVDFAHRGQAVGSASRTHNRVAWLSRCPRKPVVQPFFHAGWGGFAHYTSQTYTWHMLFIEAPIFTRLVNNYLDDDEYAALQWALALRPEAGAVIPGSGGIRKLRWAAKGRGKRGGLRVIYYWRNREGEIVLLTLYAKNEAENIPLSVLRELRKEIKP